MTRRVLAVWAVLLLGGLICAIPVLASSDLREGDEALAQRYAPVFYFHPDEVFFPQPVDVMVQHARLRQSRPLWFDVNVLLNLAAPDLLRLESDRSYFLDVWYGDDGSSAYTNYSAHRAYYRAVLSPDAGGPPAAIYAHVVRDEMPGYVTIQYWAFYFYNDWFNKHEGDWELVEVILTAEGVPEWVVLSQHHGGTRRAWVHAPVEDGTHPVVYVSLGSHANYFAGDEVYPNGKDVGSTRIEIMDRTGTAGRVIPEIIMLPDRPDLAAEAGGWPGAEWLPFRGHWGELAVQSDFGGPLGPADKEEQWEQPYVWGIAQPLDTDTWYQNRLRVAVIGADPDVTQVTLADGVGNPLPTAEALGNLALLHEDPPSAGVEAAISVPPDSRWDVVAAWPDAESGLVTQMRFADVAFADPGRAILALAPDGEARLMVEGTGSALAPSEVRTFEATWDAPDLVWISGALPAHQVVTGVLLAVLAAVVPSAIYVGALYWADQYEKEPKRLLAAAFVWGALPSVLLAVLVEMFFGLPPDLVGTRALEAVRLGIVAPVLQEALKSLMVLLIAWRYRREFDNVLDGIIYGAMVGFGFAMTGNLLNYLGSFLVWGWEGLGARTIAGGVIYALDHAFYTAAFGAGLGLGRLARARWQRWVFPAAGFGLALAVHLLHTYLAQVLLGLNPLTVVTTLVGVGSVVIAGAWSLARQLRCMQTELKDVVPDAVYEVVVEPKAWARARWQALRRGGVKGWWRVRRLRQLCAELAFKLMQQRARLDGPADSPGTEQEISRLSQEIDALVEEAGDLFLLSPRG